jgi:hypothetical protein
MSTMKNRTPDLRTSDKRKLGPRNVWKIEEMPEFYLQNHGGAGIRCNVLETVANVTIDCPFLSPSPTEVKCCLLPQVDSLKILDT